MTTFANGEIGLSVRTKINNVLQHADGTAGELVINEAGADVDFRVESDTSTHALFVDGATGNVGIGVVPSAWNAFWKNIQVTSASFGGSGAVVNYATMASNIFSDGASYLPNAKYIASGTATAYIQNAGQHQWFTAPSGTAGNAISFTQAMTLGANGNLAIGTTLASSRLTITGAGNSLGGTTEFNAEIVQENSIAKRGLFFGHDTSSQIGIVGANSGGVPSNLAFWTFNGWAWGERMRIDASGNVGIGTSSPSAPLHITRGINAALQSSVNLDATYGAGGLSHGVGFSINSNAVSAGVYVTENNGSGANLLFTTSPSFSTPTNTERMRIDASGNVGIGVVPSAWISAFRAIEFASAGSISAISDELGLNANSVYLDGTTWTYKASGFASQYRQSNSEHKWFIAPSGPAGNTVTFTQAMTLNASGTLLVGTTALPSGVGTSGVGILNASGIGGIVIGKTVSGTANTMAFYHNGTYVGGIQASDTATSFVSASDYRLKEDVQPVADAVSRLNALNPVNFAWKADGTRTDGFIAHEVQAVVPQAVTGEKDGEAMQAIDHSKLVPLLTAALQEALAEIASLKARLDAANL